MLKSANSKSTNDRGVDTLKNKFEVTDLLLSWSIPFILLIFWYVATLGQNSASLFPPPGDVGSAIIRMFNDGTLAKNIEISAVRAAAGFVIGGLVFY